MANLQQRIDKLVSANSDYVANYKGSPMLQDIRNAAGPNGKGVTILTCSDARVVPEQFFASAGQAAVIRNAGGRAMDAMRSILTLGALFTNGAIIVVHHTDCGTTHVSNADIRKNIEKERGPQGEDLANMNFGAISDLSQSVKEDVHFIKTHPYIHPDVEVLGMILDLKTGRVSKVDC